MADRKAIMAKHKAEKKELLAECQRLKHGIPKGDKKRKKEITEQITRLEEKLESRHRQELQALEGGNDNDVGVVSEALSELATGDAEGGDVAANDGGSAQQQQQKKSSKAQKRRDKKNAQQRERDEMLKEAETANLQGPRHLENVKLQTLLSQKGLRIHQIASDGNCMYNAIKHQLSQRCVQESNESLRQKTAAFMRSKRDDFMPFLTNPNTGDPVSEEEYEKYCDDVANTPAWGGHLELRAVSEALSIPMEVVQAEGPMVSVGDDYKGEPVVLVYHRHALGLGEHYNSVVPRSPDDEEETAS